MAAPLALASLASLASLSLLLLLLRVRFSTSKQQIATKTAPKPHTRANKQNANNKTTKQRPQGTCVNNEYCVMFKRGAFDIGATVCPVAIKYNKIFVDAFWNSKRQSFTQHLAGS